MSDIKSKLLDMLAGKGVMRGSEWRDRLARIEAERQSGAHEIDKVVPGRAVTTETGAFYHVCENHPLEFRQGAVSLRAALDAQPEHVALAGCDAELGGFNPRTTLFIDTETTGLAGGAGTVAFLIGAGRFQDDCFQLEQCFMRDFDEEEPMLDHLTGLFEQCETVVSYNGKSFDLPLLRSRFIANRRRFPLENAVHYDLLHAARRFWKLRLKDCSLGHVEEAVLGLQRQGDIPSALIPQIWLDYLRDRDARKLGRVFYHHKMDILSLAALTGLLGHALAAPHGEGFEHAEDRLALMRIHFRQKRYADAAENGRRLLTSSPPERVRRECLWLTALSLKRLGRYSEMAKHLDELLRQAPRDFDARRELAKYYEHRARDLARAERLCVETLQLLDTCEALGRAAGFGAGQREAFSHRLQRVRGKLRREGKSRPAVDPPDAW